MSGIRIVTDTASDITAQQAQQMNVRLVPLSIAFGERKMPMESEEDFLALDPAEVFTDELKSAVAAADPEALEPSEAGFVLSDENGKPNVIFGVVGGELAVKGINY